MKLAHHHSSLHREWRYLLVAAGAGLYLGAIAAAYVASKVGGW